MNRTTLTTACSLCLPLFVSLVTLIISFDTQASDDILDIQAELARPGVKLLVVEFYATTCKPCMRAVPKWKALHNKYQKDGLRFIVVSAEEDKTCSRPPAWSPDKTICDEDWDLTETMGVQKLPTSFLYSWEGKLAMKSHQVLPVEDAIRSYFKDTHYKIELDRVKVEGDKYAISSNPNWVQDEVAAQIRKLSKFDVVTSSSRFVSKKQADVCDRSFPPNSVLRITLRGYETGERSLSLALEKDGCTKAGSNQPYAGKGLREDKKSLKRAIRRGVRDILSQLVHVRKPEIASGDISGDGDDWFSEAELAVLRFESNPEGATVLVDNQPACDATPCSKSFPKGMHIIAMLKTDYVTKKQSIDISDDKTLQWKLRPNFGWLTVEDVPEGLDVKVDGQVVGTTPLSRHQLSPGRHRVALESRCYYPQSLPQSIRRNKTTAWSPKVKAREGGLDIKAMDEAGNDLRADVFVDGKKIGRAPGRFKVNICAKKLEVVVNKLYIYKKALSVNAKQITSIIAKFNLNHDLTDQKKTTQKKTLKLANWVIQGSGTFSGDKGKVFRGVGTITGVRNVGLARTSAGEDARKELAKIFNTYVASMTKIYRRSAKIGTHTITREERKFIEIARSFSETNISDSRIVEFYYDAPNNTWYALAEMNLNIFKDFILKHKRLSKRLKNVIKENSSFDL